MPSLRSRMIRRYIKIFVSGIFRESRSLRYQRRAFAWTFSLVPRLRKFPMRMRMVGGVSTCWVRPRGNRPNGLVIYLHGGGFCLGTLRTYRKFGQYLSRACGAEVVVVNYRLAPECPFPAALEDCLAVYEDLIENHGISPAQLALGGDSAGGGLALATTIALRERGRPIPRAIFALSPWTDLTLSGTSITSNAKSDFIMNEPWMRSMAKHYVPNPDQRNAPLVSPLAAELAGLPPILVQVAAKEILLDDAVRFVQKAQQSGVDAELDIWEHMWHVWQPLSFWVPEGKRALQKIGDFVRRQLASAGDETPST